MRKILISLIMITVTLAMFAQDETDQTLYTKRGVPIVPAPGDFAIGIDATPFFRYAGNLFSNSNPYYPSFGFTAQDPGSIFLKYKASEAITYRAALLVGYSNETSKSENFIDPDQEDKTTTSALSIGLTAGIERHREFFGRLSGYIGAQAGVRNDPYYDSGGFYGTLTYKDGNDENNNYKEVGGCTLRLSAGGFAGVEFYFAPKIALMGELGYYLSYYMQGNRTFKPESGTDDIIDHGGSGFEFAPMPSGNLVLLFYF